MKLSYDIMRSGEGRFGYLSSAVQPTADGSLTASEKLKQNTTNFKVTNNNQHKEK